MEHEFYFPYMGCHPNPIDELHYFWRWLLHHQPDKNACLFFLSFLFGTWSIAALCLALPMFCCFFRGRLGAFNSFIEFTKPGIEQLSNECDAHNKCPRSMNVPIGKTKLLKQCGLSSWPKERYPASRKPLKASLLPPKPWLCMVLPLQSQFVEVRLCQAPIFGCIWCLDSQFASRPKARAPCWMSWLVGGGRSWMLNCGEKKIGARWSSQYMANNGQ